MGLTFAQLKARLAGSVMRDDLAPSYGDFINEGIRLIENRRSWTWMKDVVFLAIAPGTAPVQIVSLGFATTLGGGNLVGTAAAWPTGGGTVSFEVHCTIGASYYYLKGNSTGLALSSGGPAAIAPGFFKATQVNYYLLADGPTAGGAIITASIISTGIHQEVRLPADYKELQKRPAVHYVTDDNQLVPADLVADWQQIQRVWAFGGTPISTWPPRVYVDHRAYGTVLGVVEPLSQKFNFRVKYYRYLPDLSAEADTSPFSDNYPKLVLAAAKGAAFTEINDAEATLAAETEFEKRLGEAIRQDAYSEVVGRENRM